MSIVVEAVGMWENVNVFPSNCCKVDDFSMVTSFPQLFNSFMLFLTALHNLNYTENHVHPHLGHGYELEPASLFTGPFGSVACHFSTRSDSLLTTAG